MSSGGGKTQTVQQAASLPSWAVPYTKENLAKGSQVSELGYTPNYGMDVAAFSPMQMMSMQNDANTASAFGLAPQGFNALAGIPQPEMNNQGFMGYRSGNMYDEAVNQFAQRAPQQYAHMQSMFVDPQTGKVPITYDGGQMKANQNFVSTPNLGFGGGGGSNLGNTDFGGTAPMRTELNNYGYIDPASWQGALLGFMPMGGAIGAINNAEAVGTMQDIAGIDRTNFFNRAFTDAYDSVGTKGIAGNGDGSAYNYTVNIGGGVSDAGNTGLTPAEAARRASAANLVSLQGVDVYKQAVAEEAARVEAARQEAARQAAARQASARQANDLAYGSGGSVFGSGRGSSASSASRSSSALGSGSNVGSRGGNASRGFSSGGW